MPSSRVTYEFEHTYGTAGGVDGEHTSDHVTPASCDVETRPSTTSGRTYGQPRAMTARRSAAATGIYSCHVSSGRRVLTCRI
jgi:hypothetical protein